MLRMQRCPPAACNEIFAGPCRAFAGQPPANMPVPHHPCTSCPHRMYAYRRLSRLRMHATITCNPMLVQLDQGKSRLAAPVVRACTLFMLSTKLPHKVEKFVINATRYGTQPELRQAHQQRMQQLPRSGHAQLAHTTQVHMHLHRAIKCLY